MTGLDWYDPCHIPACRVHIRARLASGVEADVVGHISHGTRVWYLLDGRALRPLTAPIRSWQPLAEAWTWPHGVAPPPLLDELEPVASQALATAMERAREGPAEPVAGPGAGPGEASGQWWRDLDRVRYEPPGAVSPAHGEARLMRALATDRSIRLDLPSRRSHAAALAELRQGLADVLRDSPEVDWVPPLRPLPRDVRDYLTAMAWLVEVDPDRRQLRILLARARTPAVSWQFVGDMHGLSGARVAQIYAATVAEAVEAANGGLPRTRQRLAAIQERNREARR